MRAVKLCTNKIHQFLTWGAGQRRLTRIMAIKGWLLLLLRFLTYVTTLQLTDVWWRQSVLWHEGSTFWPHGRPAPALVYAYNVALNSPDKRRWREGMTTLWWSDNTSADNSRHLSHITNSQARRKQFDISPANHFPSPSLPLSPPPLRSRPP